MSVQNFSLVNIVLLDCSFHREWALTIESPDYKNNVDLKVDNQRAEQFLNVIVDLTYTAGPADGSIELRSEIKMVGVFLVPDDTELPVETFGSINAPAIIFPFMREQLASMSMKAGINPIMLQPVNFVKNNEVKNDNLQSSTK